MPKGVREMEDWMWLVKTNKGDFFMTVVGKWTQEKAASKVITVFNGLKLDIVAMIPRKRGPSSTESTGTILQQNPVKDKQGFDFLAGKKFWDLCGRSAEYEAEMVLLEKGER